MSARQAEGLHRIEVSRDIDGDVTGVRFVCDGTAQAICHVFPDCGCEIWDEVRHGVDAEPGHEDVIHEKDCWVEPWFSNCYETALDWIEAYDGPLDELTEEQLVSGRVETTFEGDYMTWSYAEAGATS